MKEYLELDAKKYRVEFNWNAIIDYCEQNNLSDLSALDTLANLSPAQLRQFIHCAIKEGERMDGRELQISVVELGGILKFDDIQKLMQIFKKQSSFNAANNEVTAKKKKIPFL